ncbi:hypothetical protein M5689_019126 [Euphorbia peplus]|nr:hypothetical protein M5689_019126 [Euphorbia peplus]
MTQPTGAVQRRRSRHERIPNPPPSVGFEHIPSQRLYDLYSQGGEHGGQEPTFEGVREEVVHVVTQHATHETGQASGSQPCESRQRSGSQRARSQHSGSESHESRQRSRSRSGMVNEQFSPSYLDLMNLHTSPDVVQADTYNPVMQMGESS